MGNIRDKNTLKDNSFIMTEDIVNAGYKTKELKQCPFCGGNHILTCGNKNERTGYIVYKAWCTNTDCGAQVNMCLGGEETAAECREMVINMWNRRV